MDSVSTICGRSLERSRAGGYYGDMPLLTTPWIASAVARIMQAVVRVLEPRRTRGRRALLPEFPGQTAPLTIPTSVGPASVIVYRPSRATARPPVHVNFHGGGYVLRLLWDDDPLCRCLADTAGVVVVNVDYAVAPQQQFPNPPHQAFEVVEWIARHGEEHGWDGSRLTVGGQSAGGSLAAAVARQALERRGPAIRLQVLHYPPLDLVTPPRSKRTTSPEPMLRPWMADVFDNAYVPEASRRADRLVSPAHASDTADLRGIAPALVITAEHDLLRVEGQRYAERLRAAGALAELIDVAGFDHGYDLENANVEPARAIYARIAGHVRQATRPSS